MRVYSVRIRETPSYIFEITVYLHGLSPSHVTVFLLIQHNIKFAHLRLTVGSVLQEGTPQFVVGILHTKC